MVIPHNFKMCSFPINFLFLMYVTLFFISSASSIFNPISYISCLSVFLYFIVFIYFVLFLIHIFFVSCFVLFCLSFLHRSLRQASFDSC